MKQLPEKFVQRMKKLLGEEYPLYEQAVNGEPQRGFRVNTDKISLEKFEKINTFGKERIPYVNNGYYLEEQKIGNHPYHHAGMIYVQEPAAMAPAECVDIDPDWKIIDMCAAPGGKSTQLKNKLSEKGVLFSNEIVMNRCKILTGNIERLGLKNCITTCMDTSNLSRNFQHKFDMIMVDAPCSGEGMFRKDDTAINEWSEENVLMCSSRQAQILDNAVVCLKDGGYIVYATCTFSLEENEMAVDAFLSRHPEFELVPVTQRVSDCTENGIAFEGCKSDKLHLCRRFYPHKGRGEGQFMAVLHSVSERFEVSKNILQPQKIDKTVDDFLCDVLTDYDKSGIIINGNKVCYFTADFEVKKPVFSLGVTVGEIKKGYILPHHQFFMALSDKFKRKINLSADSVELKKYLHGEEFDTQCENGWAVVTVEDCAIGGVKVTGGRAKNHYPKGLRTL